MFPYMSEFATNPMPIQEFLLQKKPWWANHLGCSVVVRFRIIDEHGIYKYFSVGLRQLPVLECYMEAEPGKYAILDDIGELMGEMMDISIQFSIWKVSIRRSFDHIEYTLWLEHLDDGQETNIDADMVEKFSKKVFGK